MNKYLKIILFFSLAIILCGCGKDKDDELTSSKAEYYVKYEASLTGYGEVTVATENGLMQFSSGKSFSQTFGPFKKGDNAYIRAKTDSWTQKCHVSIYVCRGSEPFALKRTKSGGQIVSVSYQIDY